MSSRQEQKERRRQEREERERAEAATAQRKKLAGMAGGAVIVVAIIAAIVIIATGAGGGDGGGGNAKQDAPSPLPVPPQRQANLQAAVKAADCVFKEFRNEGQDHETKAFKPTDYKTNPPTSGNHNPIPAHDGFFLSGQTPALGNYVHSLEHGRIQIQYKPGTPLRFQRQLQSVFNEPVAGGPDGYHMMMFQNTTGMPFQVAAVAWTRYVGCNSANQKVFDAIRAFRDKYVDQAPESVPGRE